MDFKFLMTQYDGSTKKPSYVRVRPMSNQREAPSGEVIETSLNVSCDHDIRDKYTVGCVFAAQELIINRSKATHYYDARPSKILPLANERLIIHAFVEEKLKRLFMVYLKMNYIDAYNLNIDLDPSLGSAIGKVAPPVAAPDASTGKTRVKLNAKSKRTYPTLFQKMEKDELYRLPNIEDDGFYVTEDNWLQLVRNTIKRKPTILLGPTGTGKTALIKLLQDRIGKTLHTLDMGTIQDPQSSLLGTHRLKQGSSVFDYAPFADYVQQPDSIVFEELSRAPLAAANILFPVLDDRKTLPVEMADAEHARVISVNPKINFYATANIGSEYTGTQAIDRALIDRFLPIELEYADADTEARLIIKRTRCKPEHAETIATVASEIRDNYFDGQLSDVVSHRHTIECGAYVFDGFDIKKAMEYIFLPLFPGTRTKGEKSSIIAIIEKH